MKAIASITIDGEFVVHDIRVIDGNNGMFVAMPSKKTPDGEFRDIAHPISSETRQKIQDARPRGVLQGRSGTAERIMMKQVLTKTLTCQGFSRPRFATSRQASLPEYTNPSSAHRAVLPAGTRPFQHTLP